MLCFVHSVLPPASVSVYLPWLLAATAWLPLGAAAQAGAACHPQGNPTERTACVIQAVQVADTQLTQTYSQRMHALPAGLRMALRREQHQWLRTRSSQCHAATAHRAQADHDYHRCLLARIQERQKQLDLPPTAPP